jgi:hypothetical protein
MKRRSSVTKTGGNGRDYTLLRLDRERPDIAADVRQGKISANAAAIAAGFRRKSTPFEQIMKLTPRLTAEERRDIAVRWLADLRYEVQRKE